MKKRPLFLKQTFKSLGKTKFSVILLTFFLCICSWLICAFSFMHTSLNKSIKKVQTESNLASAMVSTNPQAKTNLVFDKLDANNSNNYTPSTTTVLNPYYQDPEVTTNLSNKGNAEALAAIKEYYSLSPSKDLASKMWMYVSTPGTDFPADTVNVLKNYTSLLIGQNKHLLTIKKIYADTHKKSLNRFVDVWTLFKDGIPFDLEGRRLTVEPYDFVAKEINGKSYLVGWSEFSNARVEGIELNTKISVSHTLFDIVDKRPVYNRNIIPTENNILSVNSDKAYVATVGFLPDINTNPEDWKPVQNDGQPNWSKATPLVHGWGIHAIYGRIYKSLCANPNAQMQIKSRIYKPSVDLNALNPTQKIISYLLDSSKIPDETLKIKIQEFESQFKGDKEYEKFLKNLNGCLNPVITVVESPEWKENFNKLEDYYSQTLESTEKKISKFFNEIVDNVLSTTGYLNLKKIKLVDIINEYASFGKELEKLNLDSSVTKLLNAQVSTNNLEAIIAYKGENPTINKVVSNNYNRLFDKKYEKKYNEIELFSSFKNYMKFGLTYGWESKKLAKGMKGESPYQNQPFKEKEAKALQPSLVKITWLLKQLNYFGEYEHLQTVINYFETAGSAQDYKTITDCLLKLIDIFQFESITMNDGMIEVSFKCANIQQNGTPSKILTPMNASYIDSSSYLTIVNDSWLEANKDKAVIPENLLVNLMSCNYGHTFDSTKTTFIDAINKLDDKYKININGMSFIIVGSGVSADLAYPCTDQYSFDKKSNVVLYVNERGFEQAHRVDTSNERIWIGIKSKDNNPIDIVSINEKLKTYLNNNEFFLSNDKKMKDKILYQSINFPSELVNKILFLSILFCSVSAFFAILVIFMNMKHVIKNNIGWIGIAVANGFSKKRFIFSNWATSLCISLGTGVVSSLVAILTYPLLNFFISDYWTLPIIRINFFWIIPIVCLVLFLLIYFGSIFISMSLLNKPTLNLITNTKANAKTKLKFASDKRINIFKMTSRFMIGKFGKIIGTTLVSLFVSFLISISFSLSNKFIESYNISNQNISYSYAMDLYSPTIQGGGYNLNTFNEIPDSINKKPLEIYTSGIYSKKVNLVKNPYSGFEMTNLWLPESDILLRDLKSSLQFLEGKMINQLALNLNITFEGSQINLWERAINILPAPFISYINNNTKNMLDNAYAFYLDFGKNLDLSKAYYDAMKFNKPANLNINPWTFNGAQINPNDTQNDMLYKTTSGLWEWTTSGKNTIITKNNFSVIHMKDSAIRLLIYLVTNHQNPVYVQWCKEHNRKMAYPYWLGLNEISNEILLGSKENLDPLLSTYTYIDAIDVKNNVEHRINGIREDTPYVHLRDYKEQNKVINNLISLTPEEIPNIVKSKQPIPMIISEVSSRLDNKKIGDIYTFNISNYLNRFVDKFNKSVNDLVQNVNFKVVGISREKMKSNYWIDVDASNYLLGYDALAPEKRFNGIYYTPVDSLELNNMVSIYSPSGLSVLATSFPNTYDDLDENMLRNPLVDNIYNVDYLTGEPVIDTIVKFKLVESLPNNNGTGYGAQTQKALNAVLTINSIFGSTLIHNSVQGGDVIPLSGEFSKSMDHTIQDFTILIVLVFLPILLCVNILFAALLIEDINSILGLLLTLGYSKSKLIAIFTSSLSIWMLIGFVFGLAASIIVPSIFNQIIWTSFNIITNATIGLVEIGVSVASYALFVGIVWFANRLKLEKTSILSLISCFQTG